MSKLEIRVALGGKTFDEIRPALQAAVEEDLPDGVVEAEWDGDVLLITGFGIRGRISHQDGDLVAQATLKMPASLMRPVFEERVEQALHDAVSGWPAEPEPR